MARERSHPAGERARERDRRDLRDVAWKGEVRVGVESHGDRLAAPQMLHVGLVDAGAHLHGRLVHHLQHGRAGPELIAFLDVARPGAFPSGAGHHEALNRGSDGERRRVGRGVLHRGVRAIALDFEHAQLGARGLPLQIEARPQGGETLARLIEILVVLLGLDRREHLVLQHLQLEVRHLVRGLLTLALVLDPRRFVLGPLLRDLLDEVAILRGLLEGQLVLVLPIELHQHLTTRDVRARTDEARDDQGCAPAALPPPPPRRRRRRSGRGP